MAFPRKEGFRPWNVPAPNAFSTVADKRVVDLDFGFQKALTKAEIERSPAILYFWRFFQSGTFRYQMPRSLGLSPSNWSNRRHVRVCCAEYRRYKKTVLNARPSMIKFFFAAPPIEDIANRTRRFRKTFCNMYPKRSLCGSLRYNCTKERSKILGSWPLLSSATHDGPMLLPINGTRPEYGQAASGAAKIPLIRIKMQKDYRF